VSEFLGAEDEEVMREEGVILCTKEGVEANALEAEGSFVTSSDKTGRDLEDVRGLLLAVMLWCGFVLVVTTEGGVMTAAMPTEVHLAQ
jgi:hypothetical protein